MMSGNNPPSACASAAEKKTTGGAVCAPVGIATAVSVSIIENTREIRAVAKFVLRHVVVIRSQVVLTPGENVEKHISWPRSLSLGGASLVASFIPLRRAGRVDPVKAVAVGVTDQHLGQQPGRVRAHAARRRPATRLNQLAIWFQLPNVGSPAYARLVAQGTAGK